LPDDFPSESIQSCDDSTAATVCRDEDMGAVQHRRGAKTLMSGELRYLGLPQLFAVDVKCGRVNGVGVQEIDENAIAIAGGCCRGRRGLLISFANKTALMNECLPSKVSRRAIEAQYQLCVTVLVGCGNYYAITDDNWRTVTTAG